jgi:glycerol-3-phosphate dehydrogenase
MSDVDVLVVGGGIQGAGVLQAAAAAGYRALLIEASDFARGTSSRSSKLIHGGLRYLETMQLALVRESLRERKILLEIAPHLVELVPFFVPVYRRTTRRPWQIRAGLSLYATLGGLVEDARFSRVPRREWETLDGLTTEGLVAVFRYMDGQTDDAALVRAVIASARELEAEALRPAEMVSAVQEAEAWRVRYRTAEGERECSARVLVNAAGPWINEVAERVVPRPPGCAVDLVQGAHIEVPGALERGIYYTEARDHRAVFTIPWKGHTMVGTTELTYTGDPAEVHATEGEITYLQETLADHFPAHSTEILDAWAGLRVLPRAESDAFDRPRDVTLVPDDPAHPSYLAIYGGKLTGYRATAEKVLDWIARSLPPSRRRADTATLRLPE